MLAVWLVQMEYLGVLVVVVVAQAKLVNLEMVVQVALAAMALVIQ